MPEESTKVLLLGWDEPTGNPYLKLLAAAIKKRRPNLEFILYSEGSITKLLKAREKFIIHIHWPNVLYQYDKSLLKEAGAPLRFLKNIVFSKIFNRAKIIWTVHNYESYDYLHPRLDKFIHRCLFHLADSFIVHTEAGWNFLNHNGISNDKIYIIPHGNFTGFYGKRLKRGAARKNLNFNRNTVIFLNLGLLRPYKGLEELALEFNTAGQSSRRRIRLAIAGRKIKSVDAEKFRKSVSGPAISLYDRPLDANEVAAFLGASDFFVIKHRRFLTSGAAILALSYGLPVLAPRSGDMPYIIKHGENGFLYDPEDNSTLRGIILTSSNLPENKRLEMSKKAMDSVKKFTWDFVARETLKVYEL